MVDQFDFVFQASAYCDSLLLGSGTDVVIKRQFSTPNNKKPQEHPTTTCEVLLVYKSYHSYFSYNSYKSNKKYRDYMSFLKVLNDFNQQ